MMPIGCLPAPFAGILMWCSPAALKRRPTMSGSKTSKARRKSMDTRNQRSHTDMARVMTAPDYVWDGKSDDDRPATAEELRAAKPRGPQKAPTKMLMSMRFSRDVLEHFRASGPAWQVRMDAVLRASLVLPKLPLRPKR